MTRRFAFFIVALADISLTLPVGAQADADSLRLRVEITASTPSLEGVLLRGDSAIFLTQFDGEAAYIYDRAGHRFTRGVRSRNGELHHANNARSPYSFYLPDSLLFQDVWIDETLQSAIIKDTRGRTIALRGPRVQFEKEWRRKHGLSENPAVTTEDYDRHEHARDWGGIDPLSYAADSAALWLGIDHSEQLYDEFALGGLLRIDRKTHRVSVVGDSAVLHASISQIEPVPGGYLLIADGEVLRFDPRTERVTKTQWSSDAIEVLVARDTVFIAGASSIAIASLRDTSVLRKGFELHVEKDSVIYVLADKTVEPSYDTLAIIGAAERLGIRRLNDWLKSAQNKVHASAIEFYFPGDNYSAYMPIADVEGSARDGEERQGPNAIQAEGLDHPSLRPFLREALLQPPSYAQLDIARILLYQKDTAAVPFLRTALKNYKGAYGAELATALAQLGDTAGNAWVHAALLDTMHSAGTLDTTQKIHSFTFEAAGQLLDPRNVGRLLELSTDPRYSFAATVTLLKYRSPEIAQKLLNRIVHQDSALVVSEFLRCTADSTFPMTPALRRSVIDAATETLYKGEPGFRTNAVIALARDASAAELPVLIGSLTLDESTYATAVVQLVRLTGTGVEEMPNGKGTPETRATAQRWWSSWYAAHARDFKPKAGGETQTQVNAMLTKLNR